jgi:N-acetylneuraminic acid mutarotase
MLSNAPAQPGAWVKKTNIPTARTGSAACVINDTIYLLGGMGPTGSDLPTNEMFDPLTNTWQHKRSMPTARGFLSAAAVDGIIYAIGGGYPSSKYNVEAYDPATDTWTPKKNMLNARLGAHAAVVDGIIYNIGGNYSERNCEAYDPATDTWTARTPMPESGGVVATVVWNGLIYVFGGGYYTTYNTLYVYDPKANYWTKKSDMLTGRFAFQAYVVDGKIYAVGGAPQEHKSLATVEIYDPATDSWDMKANMPEKASWFAGAVAGGKIYLMGGTPEWLTGGVSVWEYDPAYHSDIAAGEVSGIWTTSASPYHINGEIAVPNAATLTIEPGVEVVFMGHYKFNVQGRVLAIGTEANPILFTAATTGIGWHGLRFINTPQANDTSKLVNCSFRNGTANTGGWTSLDRCGGAVTIDGFGKVLVMNCVLAFNTNAGDISTTGGAAIFVRNASPLIEKNTFSNNTGTTDCAIFSTYANVIISDNTFSQNSGCHAPITCAYGHCVPIITGNRISHNITTRAGGGIFTVTSSAIIANNIITYNSCFGVEGEGGGIKCWINDKPLIINNTIAFNSAAHGGGLCCNQNADPLLINNILWGNTSNDGNQVNCLEGGSDPDILFCDIQGGKDGFGGAGAGVYYSGLYEHNIDLDPLFVNPSGEIYSLKNTSPCIGAGVDTITVAGVVVDAPPFCIMGNSRPSPIGSNPDIGACENSRGTPDISGITEEERTAPWEFSLSQNYPNPFNPRTVISSQLPVPSHVQLVVYDLLGREVAVLVNERRAAGSYGDTFDASALASGVYIYRLIAGSFVSSRAMLLLK